MGIFDWKHWLVILIVVVLIFGTKRLKTLGSDLGETIKGFRKAMHTEDEETPKAGNPSNEPLQKPQTIDGHSQKVDDPLHKN
ncbi:twin-arginine translocase TatA/TatE family subunit [Azomonas macrocytogenes]|uniref:Sec-independent protein translocase protein TatA n=1 Tax=Azomonas macrocytogenes TaxID=69962 RepID=A0A839T4N1_AZOMA|nr:twin-arginine translocase TatA/TatE family subunit [Azomonas macrocytogenes]MBB3102885.1 sec-independent protein translocase protein TatA [Azomonas macrocytogenes]